MIGLLRLIGVFNGAIWLGGTFFFTAVVSSSVASREMVSLLQPRNFPYFSPAIHNILLSSFFQFSVVCALIALLHLAVEWLYLGRPSSKKLPLLLTLGLLLYGIMGGKLMQPHLKSLHTTRFSAKVTSEERESAARSFNRWRLLVLTGNCVMIVGLGFHFWKLTNPSDTPRFVSSVKFRG